MVGISYGLHDFVNHVSIKVQWRFLICLVFFNDGDGGKLFSKATVFRYF